MTRPEEDQSTSSKAPHKGMQSFRQWRPQVIIESETEGVIEPALNLLWRSFVHHARQNGFSVITKSSILAPRLFVELSLVLRIDSSPERLTICPWPGILEFPELKST